VDAGVSQAEGQLERAFASLLDGEDAQAAPLFQAVLRSKGSGGPSGAPQRLAASYGAGVAAYNLGRHAESAALLATFFEAKAACEAEGRDYTAPPLGTPLARFYLAHSTYALGRDRWPVAADHLRAYLREVELAGPQRVLNMPNGWQGRAISEGERKASRFRNRACSDEARADAHAMLSLIAEQGGGAEAALEDARRAAELAQAGGVVEQRAAAAERLAQLHAALGDTAAAEEQAALAAAAHAEAAEKAAKEAREREEREKKESEDQSMAAVGGDEAAAEAPGVGDGDRD